MIQLYDQESGTQIGTISEDELHYLMEQLEEEALEDQDYYIDAATLDWFEDHGAKPDLTALLRKALGSREGMDIRWARSQGSDE